MKNRLLYLFLILSLTGLYGQTYNFSKYAEENGLPQSYIYCISQSYDGYLTLSAGEAVCMFDGAGFTSLTNRAMAENMVTTHFTDSRNITWLGHQQYGLSYIKDKRFAGFDNKILAEVKISQITEYKNHTIWLAGSNGIYSIDAGLKLSPNVLLKDRMIRAIAADAKNNLLAGTPEGLAVISLGASDNVESVTEIAALKDKNIRQIIAADASDLVYWVLTDDGIYGIKYHNKSYMAERFIFKELKSEGFNLSCIYKDRYNNLWVSVFGDGLRRISFDGSPLKGAYSVSVIDKKNGLKSRNIQSIYQDPEGNMWFGTFGEGLIKKPLEMFSFYGDNEGLSATDVKKAVTDAAGNLWMATDAGLAMYNRVDHVYRIYNGSNGFINDKLTTLFLDSEGILWIGTASSGIYMLNRQTLKFERMLRQKTLNKAYINVIVQVGDRIMAGTTDGIFVFDMKSDWSEVLTTNDGLLHNNVLHLFSDSQRRLWVASHSSPPYFIKDQAITSFKEIEGLNAYNITATCEDKEHNIWIATEGDGVFKYNNRAFSNYTTDEGLLSNYCHGIETDKNNSVWVTHKSGLSELQDNLKKFSGFKSQRGLLFTDNNTNAIFRDTDANLWFGTTQGVVEYNAGSEKSSGYMPGIFISHIRLNNDSFGGKEPVVKKYGYYSVRIDYKAIYLSDPGAIYYKYRLVDVDTTWKTTVMPYVDIPKLGDGEYTFEVIACNAVSGVYSSQPAAVSFIIQKPAWKHAWFYVLLLFMFIMLSYGVLNLRTRSLKRTQALLELKIEEKTHLLKQEKEAVEIIKTDLENKNRDITASIHYAKNIQDSLLPPNELMKELFNNNYFVLYKPKDIVSGDFYWCSGTETNAGDGLCLAGVIDCTGHGVPGAFLSILANDFLKQSVSQEYVKMPNQILDYLNRNISSHLNQHSSKSRIRDGMDVAMVGIDYTKKKLYYSGANNPVYIFRQGAHGVEEIIIKATKQAIGSVNELILGYELKTFDLQAGDTVYLFSDGYADQFGGERDKKITYKTFRAILSQAFVLPIVDQKAFIEARFENWKRHTEQTDDVCVMGIRI